MQMENLLCHFPCGGRLFPFSSFYLDLNSFFTVNGKNTNEKLSNLALQKDTIIQKQVVYQIDTIFQTRIIREEPVIISTASSGFLQAGSIQGLTFSLSPPSESWKGTRFTNSALPPLQAFREQSSSGSTINSGSSTGVDQSGKNKNHLYFGLRGLKASSPFPASELPPEDLYLSPALSSQSRERSKMEWTRQLWPQSFQMGPEIGIEIWEEQEDQHNNALLAGVTGSIGFGNRLGFNFSAARSRISIRTIEANGFLGIPDIPPPSDDFKLEKIEVHANGWRNSLGLHYVFTPYSKWQVFAGAGISMLKVRPFRAEFEFKNDNPDEKTEIYQNVSPADQWQNYFQSRIGLNYQWAKHFSLQLNGEYLLELNEQNNLGINRSLGLKLGLLYKL